MPLISIILPTHNRPKLLEEAIESVIAQNITDWELIIIDDNSNPPVDKQYIQNKFSHKVHVLHHNLSKGGSLSKNTGIEVAKGKYIAFLDDDDLYAPTYLEEAINTLEKYPEISTLFMGVSWFGPKAEWAEKDYDKAMSKVLADANGETLPDNILKFDARLFDALLKRVPMAFQRPVTLKRNLQQIGLFHNTLLWDCDWALRAALNKTCGLHNDGLYLQRTAGQGYSSKPSRRLEHMQSNLEIKKSLYNTAKSSCHRRSIKQAIINVGEAITWEYMNQKKGAQALIAIIKTFRFGFSLSQVKFFFHALLILITKK